MFKDTSMGKESMFRQLAKKYEVDVNEVENIHKIFRRYDEDDSGEIESAGHSFLIRSESRRVRKFSRLKRRS